MLLRLIFNAEMKVHAEVAACFWLSVSEKGKFLVREYYYHLHSTFPTSSGEARSMFKLEACSIC